MARPLRRVIAQLVIRLGIPPDVIETWDFERLRELLVVLLEKPKEKTSDGVLRLAEEQTPAQIEHALSMGFGKFS